MGIDLDSYGTLVSNNEFVPGNIDIDDPGDFIHMDRFGQEDELVMERSPLSQ